MLRNKLLYFRQSSIHGYYFLNVIKQFEILRVHFRSKEDRMVEVFVLTDLYDFDTLSKGTKLIYGQINLDGYTTYSLNEIVTKS